MASNEGGDSSRSPSRAISSHQSDSSSIQHNVPFVRPSTSTGHGRSNDGPSPSNSSSRRHKRRNTPLHGSGSLNSIGVVPGIFTGVPGSLVDKDSEFLCPICFEIYREAHMTKCGHSFCHECILKSMEQSPRCPKCNFQLESKDSLFPNFILDELVTKQQRKLDGERLIYDVPSKAKKIGARANSGDLKAMSDAVMDKSFSSTNSQTEKAMLAKAEILELKDIDTMIKVLTEKRFQLEADAFLTEHTLLQDFLSHLKRLKDDQLIQLKRETSVIQSDLERITNLIKDIKVQSSDRVPGNTMLDQRDTNDHEIDASNIATEVAGDYSLDQETYGGNDSTEGASNATNAVVPTTEGFNVFPNKSSIFKTTLPQRRQRINTHFEDLASCYFSMRASQMAFPAAEECGSQDLEGQEKFGGLEEFSRCLAKFTRYSKLHPLATLSYTTDIFNNASIVSSIEFDKDNELFAIAGVTKRIKVYDYNVVLKDIVDIHYPSIEMVCGSKISCISWNSFHKSTLASSDYDCSIIVWDANTAQRVRTFQEHEKRCWSVDFNSVDTKLLASGSDDARVKLWSANINHSVASLEAKANVCCVKFNPTSCYHLAFGSADHCVHYYDLRNSKNPLNVFRGHKKAVSYVKFFNSTDIISASTDSQLKLWNVNQKNCIRSFTGHINEKNFVGLATDGDYMTCGSENNGLYIYYKGLSKPLFNFKFDSVRSLLDRDRKEDDTTNEFVSAVCWRQNSPIILAANSQGTIKVLELKMNTEQVADNRIPKVLVFDLDGCVWDPEMYELWGGGGSPFTIAKDGNLSDRSGTTVKLLGDIRKIMHEFKTDPKWSDAIIAVASSCDEPSWAKECIQKFPVGFDGKLKLKDIFSQSHIEIYKSSKDHHLQNIKKKCSDDISFQDFIFFDNQKNNCVTVSKLGVTVVYTPDGVTRQSFEEGLEKFPAPGQIIGPTKANRW